MQLVSEILISKVIQLKLGGGVHNYTMCNGNIWPAKKVERQIYLDKYLVCRTGVANLPSPHYNSSSPSLPPGRMVIHRFKHGILKKCFLIARYSDFLRSLDIKNKQTKTIITADSLGLLSNRQASLTDTWLWIECVTLATVTKHLFLI